MNLQTLMNENIPELLIKIIEFANARQKILMQNITNCHGIDFVPKDLEMNEFCQLLNDAIDEYIKYKRIIFCDTENIKFQSNGSLQIRSVIDESAKKLLEDNREEYFKAQINKLFENSLNQRIAAELLSQGQGCTAANYRTIDCSDDVSNKKGFVNN